MLNKFKDTVFVNTFKHKLRNQKDLRKTEHQCRHQVRNNRRGGGAVKRDLRITVDSRLDHG